MTNNEIIKEKLMNELGVEPTESFDVKSAIRKRIDYLKNYLKSTGRTAFVLGISGGVDSTTAGKLAQIAVSELRNEGYESKFIAMRLPYNVQKDENEAQAAVQFINADELVTVNIGSGVDSILDAGLHGLFNAGFKKEDAITSTDFAKGNVKARMRMIAQYQVAGLHNGLVLGTDHNAEAANGFYTLHGDGACDLIVLNGLNKRQVRLCAKEMGAPEWLWSKVATADLEDDNPQLEDEVALGVTYDEVDDLLEGKKISKESEDIILNRFNSTEFKRRMPMSFN